MPYLIDSDWLIDYMTAQPTARELLESLADEGVSLSVITSMEIYEGFESGRHTETARSAFDFLLEEWPLLPVSAAVALRCARLRDGLRRQGKRVTRRALDLLIAATALEHALTLVTRNTRDYDDIPGLDLYGVAGSAGV
jgi:predicted nucleic acid-binding protein